VQEVRKANTRLSGASRGLNCKKPKGKGSAGRVDSNKLQKEGRDPSDKNRESLRRVFGEGGRPKSLEEKREKRGKKQKTTARQKRARSFPRGWITSNGGSQRPAGRVRKVES